MKNFELFSEEIQEESAIISDFIENAKDGDCIILPVFTKIFKSFRSELWSQNPRLFFDNKPFEIVIYPQFKREFPARSSMISKCTKFIFLNYWDGQYNLKLPKDPNSSNPDYIKAAQIGTAIHEILQRELCLFGIVEKDDNGNFLLEKEIYNKNKLITGHIDFIGNFKEIYDLDYTFVGEIKTTGSNLDYKNSHYHKIDTIIKNGHPMLFHLPQGNLYMDEMKLDFEMFYYTDRGNTSLDITFLYKKDRNLIKEINKKIKKIKKYFQNNEIPKIKTKTQKRCKFCPYTQICDDINNIEDIVELCRE